MFFVETKLTINQKKKKMALFFLLSKSKACERNLSPFRLWRFGCLKRVRCFDFALKTKLHGLKNYANEAA